MNRSQAMSALLTGLLACFVLPGAAPPERDVVLQGHIDAVVTAVVQEPEATTDRVDALRQAAEGRRQALLLQLALFLRDSRSTEEAMVGGMLLRALEFTPQEKLAAALPHLDTEAADLYKVLAEILATIDRPEGGTPDFTLYEKWLRRQGRQAGVPLIRYMYRVSPDEARSSMARVFGGGDVTTDRTDRLEALVVKHAPLDDWSAADRALARETLHRLAQDPAWWVRLYAAATLQRAPELSGPALLERLAADPDRLVRSMAPGRR